MKAAKLLPNVEGEGTIGAGTKDGEGTMEERRGFELTSVQLHVLAMGLMMCDHMWATLFPAQEWLTCVGRLAYPIFAFLLAEGYAHTGDLRRYALRLLVWAVLSEVPFDLMYGGSVFYPFHQNVLWTFLLSLGLLVLTNRCRARFRPWLALPLTALLALAGYVLGYAAMVDYYGAGVLMVLVFHLFRGRDWKNRLAQLVCLYILNVSLLGSYYYEVTLFGLTLELVQQGLALAALVPIWLYRGRQGHRSRAFQYFCYAFYPLHILALVAVQSWILG